MPLPEGWPEKPWVLVRTATEGTSPGCLRSGLAGPGERDIQGGREKGQKEESLAGPALSGAGGSQAVGGSSLPSSGHLPRLCVPPPATHSPTPIAPVPSFPLSSAALPFCDCPVLSRSEAWDLPVALSAGECWGLSSPSVLGRGAWTRLRGPESEHSSGGGWEQVDLLAALGETGEKGQPS